MLISLSELADRERDRRPRPLVEAQVAELRARAAARPVRHSVGDVVTPIDESHFDDPGQPSIVLETFYELPDSELIPRPDGESIAATASAYRFDMIVMRLAGCGHYHRFRVPSVLFRLMTEEEVAGSATLDASTLTPEAFDAAFPDAAPDRPREADVPHWGWGAVNELRHEFSLPPMVTDRMIYAALNDAHVGPASGSASASEAAASRLLKWVGSLPSGPSE